MSDEAVRELLRPYLPRWLRDRIGASGLVPGALHTTQAVVLYADLSGFTRLTAAFADLPDGAELLYESLNRLYGALAETVFAHGGDIASIAGDALTAWWPDRPDLGLGRDCGEAMHGAMAALPPIATPHGLFRLDLRVGVAAGPVRAALVGLPSHGVHLVLIGPTVNAATAAERVALPGTTVVIEAPVAADEPEPAAPAAPEPAGEATPLSEEHFLPHAFVERLRLNALFAEYRRCVPVFATFEMPPRAEDLHAFVARAQAIVLRWGGWLNEVEIGDKGSLFVLLFGAPTSHGDDPARAVGCCLELRARGLVVQAGITVGTLFVGGVGGPRRRVFAARGDEMNLAARLMQHAAPGEIVVSGRIRQEILGRYAVGEPENIEVKGQSRPIPIARVGERAARATLRPVAAAPIVGREAERRALAVVMRAALDGQGQLVCIQGESGIGKTTLAQELVARWVEGGQTAFVGACGSGDRALPLNPWRPIAAALCGVDDRHTAGGRDQLARALRGLPGGPHLLRWLADSAAEVEPQQLISPLLALIQRRVALGPLLICLEDIHWADDLSLQLVARLAAPPADEGACPLLLLLTHRPGGPPSRALKALLGHPAASLIELPRLRESETRELSRLVLGVADVRSDLADYLRDHTEGQPVLIRESLLALRERGLIVVEGSEARLARPRIDPYAVDSARDMVQAAVDRLDEHIRQSLRIAAVIGRSFSLETLAAVHPERPAIADLRNDMTYLVSMGLIDLVLSGPSLVFRFRSSVTHDVAYTSLLFAQRRAIHTAVARWYEESYRDEIARDAAPLAIYDALIEHLRRAEDAAARVRYCRAAAEKAVRQSASNTALDYIAAALPLTADPRQRFDLLALRVAINERGGNQYTQAEDLTGLDALAEELGGPLPHAHSAYYRTRHLLTMGLYQTALTLGGEALAASRRVLRESCDRGERRQALLIWAGALDAEGAAYAALGHHRTAAALHRRALALARGPVPPGPGPDGLPATPIPMLLDSTIIAARCLNHLGSLAFAEGNLDRALRLHRRSLEAALVRGDWVSEARARERLARLHIARHDYSAALEEAGSALATSHACADRLGQVLALRRMASAYVHIRNFSEAQRCAIHALGVASSIGARAQEAKVLSDLADIARAQGHEDEADAVQSEADRVRAEWWDIHPQRQVGS